jgi:hypothetical protein
MDKVRNKKAIKKDETLHIHALVSPFIFISSLVASNKAADKMVDQLFILHSELRA